MKLKHFKKKSNPITKIFHEHFALEKVNQEKKIIDNNIYTMGKLKKPHLNKKIHHSFKKASKTTKKVSHGAVKRVDKVGSFAGHQISSVTSSVKSITSSPFLLPVIGICGLGAILLITK